MLPFVILYHFRLCIAILSKIINRGYMRHSLSEKINGYTLKL
jgi:hypothetical protein